MLNGRRIRSTKSHEAATRHVQDDTAVTAPVAAQTSNRRVTYLRLCPHADTFAADTLTQHVGR
jgi:hypothetical protein